MMGFIDTSITITVSYNGSLNDCLRLAPFLTGLWVSSLPSVTDLLVINETVTSSAFVVLWLTLHSWTLNSLTNDEWRLTRESESKILYDWQFTAKKFVLLSSPLRSKTREFFFQLNLCSNSPYVTSSLTRRFVCLLWICLFFRQVYTSHICHVIENSSFFTSNKSSLSTGFAG
jgi:hypothetical protein